MNKTKVDTVVSLVSSITESEEQLRNYKIFAKPEDNKVKLTLLVGDKEEEWKVDKCIELDKQSTKERENLIDYALAGYSASAIMMSQGDAESLYEQRKHDLQLTLELLRQKLDQSEHQFKIEYACIGMRDVYCFDLRRNKVVANEVILSQGSGLDHYMRKVEDVDAIWKIVKDGSKIPFVLSIRLTDSKQMTQGYLQLFDLLRPRTIDYDKSNAYLLHDSFTHFVNMTHTIMNPNNSHLDTKNYVLTYLLAKTLAGQEKLTLFTYLNDSVPKKIMQDVVFLLNLTQQLSQVPLCILRNEKPIRARDNKKLTEAKEKNTRLKELLLIEQAHVTYLQVAMDELKHRPSIIEHELKVKLTNERAQVALLRNQMEQLEHDLQFVQRDRILLQQNHDEQLASLQSELAAKTAQLEQAQTQGVDRQVFEQERQQLENAYHEAIDMGNTKIKEIKTKYKEKAMLMQQEWEQMQKEWEQMQKEAEAEIEKHVLSEQEYKQKYEETKLELEQQKQNNQEYNKTLIELKEDIREEIEQDLVEKFEQEFAAVIEQSKQKVNQVKSKYKQMMEQAGMPHEDEIHALNMAIKQLKAQLKQEKELNAEFKKSKPRKKRVMQESDQEEFDIEPTKDQHKRKKTEGVRRKRAKVDNPKRRPGRPKKQDLSEPDETTDAIKVIDKYPIPQQSSSSPTVEDSMTEQPISEPSVSRQQQEMSEPSMSRQQEETSEPSMSEQQVDIFKLPMDKSPSKQVQKPAKEVQKSAKEAQKPAKQQVQKSAKEVQKPAKSKMQKPPEPKVQIQLESRKKNNYPIEIHSEEDVLETQTPLQPTQISLDDDFEPPRVNATRQRNPPKKKKKIQPIKNAEDSSSEGAV